MTIATDALIKGNQLIHEYVNSGKQGFRNEIVDTEMKKIRTLLRRTFSVFRTCLDHNKAIMQLSEQYPECMDE